MERETKKMNCECKRSHDVSFCTGNKCDVKRDCFRWTKNHQFGDNEFITMGEFLKNKMTKECDMFMGKKISTQEAMDDLLQDFINS